MAVGYPDVLGVIDGEHSGSRLATPLLASALLAQQGFVMDQC
jgi:hypothetical protein